MSFSWRIADRVISQLVLWSDRARQRRMLGELDDHLLRDIGLTPHQAKSEAARAFWISGKDPRRRTQRRRLSFALSSW